MEITQSFRKMVASLGTVKGRREHKCFIAEGSKCVIDTWGHFKCRYLLATSQWIESNDGMLTGAMPIAVKKYDIERMSQLTTPSSVIAIYEIPEYFFDEASLAVNLTIALDRIQDPGNLGTIMRIADWFGITDILCSEDTVDAYNPKVVQATMGAISRVKVHYCDLVELVKRNCHLPVYGTLLDGDNIYETELSANGIIIMGNEGQGLSTEIRELVSHKLFIPSFPQNRPTSESLNVGMATAITIAEFRRRMM